MNPIKGRNLVLLQKTGRRHVGAQHALFNDLVSIVTVHGHDFLDLALGIEHNLRFGGLEVDRSALGARPTQQFVQVIQIMQVRQEIRVLGSQPVSLLGIRALQHVADLVVGQPGVTAHHCLIEGVTADVARCADGHVGDHAEAVDVRIQGAQAIGELLRQHGDHVIREVHRIAPANGLFIQRRTRTHIVGHIGNRHHQAITTAGTGLAVDGVVKIPGAFVVDGYQPHVADINAIGFILFGNLGRNRSCLITHSGWPAVRDIVRPDGNINLHAGRHMLAQNFDHLACRLGANGGLAQNLHDHILAVIRLTRVFLWHQHLMVDAGILRDDKSDSAFLEEAPHSLLGTMLQHLHNDAFTAPTIIHPVYPGSYPVTVEHLAHLAGGEKEIRTAVVGHQKAKAVLVANHPTSHKIGFFNGEVSATPVTNQLPVPAHGNQTPAKSLDALLGRLAKLGTQCFMCRGRPALF